ncbi:3-methyl-2-oxobutanoate hydroxymethyltransferase [Chloracidobacterium sp. D]|uniref:3-methyl-2-oxobutanoate hydroxymethyltransferase n=1 Tax=Chloracidobacterium sp. D TaxID=2821536 RepID=UPI001B8AB238|nr:3-methyl-2-oxobutanoate hydroxymethyltransferase [Chloracidobacterium sp. D]QUV81753.1 3-methyl-2-oxobutanoate hydroxymethyltransferase [Chloracidobacterium sp. D]
MPASRVTPGDLTRLKADGKRIVALTAYDRPTAMVCEAAGVDVILVGDSLGNVLLGYETTLPVTMDDMLHHVRAVARSTHQALVVADLPFLSYQADQAEALRNAGRFLKEGGAQAVKLEGGSRSAETIERMVTAGIPVMGHLGYTPQSAHVFGRNVVQGRDVDVATTLVHDALVLEEAGCFAIVLECVPHEVARAISERLRIPTIGIGAGNGCDGQILVFHDAVGWGPGANLKFVKRYANVGDILRQAVSDYAREVREGVFPAAEHSFSMSAEARVLFEQELEEMDASCDE